MVMERASKADPFPLRLHNLRCLRPTIGNVGHNCRDESPCHREKARRLLSFKYPDIIRIVIFMSRVNQFAVARMPDPWTATRQRAILTKHHSVTVRVLPRGG